jgi:hypothetical protein
VPQYLRDPAHVFSLSPAPRDGLYVALGQSFDASEGPVSGFLASVLERVAREKPRYVAIDFRMNEGGDYTRTYPFMPALLETLPKEARVYALTSGWTFSAAITTVGALKQFGRSRVTLVGSPVGDRLAFWAEGYRFTLPNAFVVVGYTTARHDYSAACTDPDTCFWLNWVYPVRVATLQPEIDAPLSFAAYRALRDPALEAVVAREEKLQAASAPATDAGHHNH